MSRLFKRTCAVEVTRESIPDDPTKYKPSRLAADEILQISELRVKFKVIRDFTKHPNATEITISNLAPETRALMQERPLKIHLSAGYDGVNRLLALGDVHFSQSKIDGTDWVTMLQLTDGGRTFGHSRHNKSYTKNVTYRQVIRDVAGSMNLTLPAALDKDPQLDKLCSSGMLTEGPARDTLTRLLAPFGYEWSIQNGVLRVLGDNDVQAQGPLLIGEEQGMIGTPEFGSPPRSGKPPHVTIKMLLYPELTPGDKVRVTSKSLNGDYKLIKVEHQGDSMRGDWVTEAEIKPL